MSTQAQIDANRANSQKSTGPSSEAGREASSRNRVVHGLSDPANKFFLLEGIEAEWQFEELKAALIAEHNPQTETENILVRRMWESEWLRRRALDFQRMCFDPKDHHLYDEKRFALFLRYQTTHERAFYKALNELQKIRKERGKDRIGFESRKRALEMGNLKKEAQILKNQLLEFKKMQFETKNNPVAPQKEAAKSPATREMAA
jgi:hypothetical protein